ncbi:MAG: Hsp70 family protein [Myxococcota bacterium]
MAAPVLGIDLGTTNSVVAMASADGSRVLPGADGSKLVPSVVSFHPSGSVLVGAKARDRRLIDARNTVYSVKRLIGRPFRSSEVTRAKERFPFDLASSPTGGVLVKSRGESYTLSEISAFVLREVRSRAEASLGMSCSQAIITVPANFNELQRAATKAAGRVAGLDVLRILNEPTAAALAYGFSAGRRERVAVFDLGGGTFDLTILDLAGEVFEVLATAGDTYLGGDDLDTLLADAMADSFLQEHRSDLRQDKQAFERLRAAAEWAKCQLSHDDEVQLRVEELAYGENGVALDLDFTTTRGTLERLATPLFGRCFDVCEDAMKAAGLRPSQLDTVILVGGSTRMPLVRRMVAEYFGREPRTQVDPDLVVAEGAAIQGLALSTARRKKTSQASLSDSTVGRKQPAVLTEETAPRAVPLAALQLSKMPASEVGDAAAAAAPDSTRWSSAPPPEDEGTGEVMPLDESMLEEQPQPSLPPPVPPAAMSIAPPPPPVASLAPPPVARPSGPVANPAFQPPREANPAGLDAPDSHFPPPPGTEAPGMTPPLGSPAVTAPPALGTTPLLLDVTPLSLGVETVGGYCETIIQKNAAIPTEQTRLFTTALDGQTEVAVRICQGEARRIESNQLLGELQLLDLPAAQRGKVKVEVTFILDADGTLQARAADPATGKEQTVRIQLVGAIADADVGAMRERIEARYAPPG